jgi:RNA-directed DNA polymerase
VLARKISPLWVPEGDIRGCFDNISHAWMLDHIPTDKEVLREIRGKRYNLMVNFVRYADDFIITGCSKELLENEVKPLVERFMLERGLQLSPEKTCITH